MVKLANQITLLPVQYFLSIGLGNVLNDPAPSHVSFHSIHV